MNLVRQPLLPAFLTLVAIAAAAVFSRGLAPVPDAATSVLATALEEFAVLYPSWARAAAFGSIVATGLCLGHLTNRYNLYSGSCYLTMPIFGLVVCGMFPTSASLTRYVVMLLFAWATYRFCSTLRNGYSFSPLFRASLITGLMPLLAVPAVGLMGLVPLALLCFKRTAREVVVALCGLLLPAFVLCYLSWAVGAGFLSPLQAFAAAFSQQSPSFVFDPAMIALPGYVLLLIIGALLAHAMNAYALSPKGRLVILFYLLMLPPVAVLWLLPSASASTLSLIAVPSSVLLPLLLVRVQVLLGTLLYLSLLLLGAGSIFLL